MRKILVVSLALNLVAAAGVARALYVRGGWEYMRGKFVANAGASSSDAANYAHRESLFERLPKRQNPIVFAGDSLTQGCEWGEFYPGALNRGIGGDTSAGLLKRIGNITELNPRSVFLMIGINDLYNLGLSPAQTVQNIRAVVAEIRRACPQTVVYLESDLPTSNARKNRHARAVNGGLVSLADGKTVVFVNLHPAFLKGDVLNPALTSDGSHLNGDGYLLWKQSIDPYVNKFVTQ
jgi:lysophospholipase L1-like esterase